MCPISGVGTEAATEAVDYWNETTPPVFNFLANIDGVKSVPAAANTYGVVLTVETNAQHNHGGIRSQNYYDSFSLLRSMEGAFRLPCLNHACDKDVKVMSDLFGEAR